MKPQRQNYRGHIIELREHSPGEQQARGAGLLLLIDDEPVGYGQLPGGRFYLDEYAYDWREDLIDLARALLDYRSKAEKSRHGELAGPNGE